MTKIIVDTSYDAVSYSDLRKNIAMNKNTRKCRYESSNAFLKIENNGAKQITNTKINPNNNHEEWWVP
jgi:hypothetical protein